MERLYSTKALASGQNRQRSGWRILKRGFAL